MNTATVFTSVISAWSMAIAYYQIEIGTGIEVKPLLLAAVITLGIGLYFGCRNNKETSKEEA